MEQLAHSGLNLCEQRRMFYFKVCNQTLFEVTLLSCVELHCLGMFRSKCKLRLNASLLLRGDLEEMGDVLLFHPNNFLVKAYISRMAF